jgi:TolB-like protein/class 3 adenylate cyclase/Tfp pilus assembly protein PilF
MTETRKLAAILVADVVGYCRLAGADEERTLARLRALRSDLFDPTIALHHGRIVKRTGDGSLIEFRSVVDAVRCAIEVQTRMVERNAGLPPERRIEFRVGIHLGDVVEESDGDLMGDGVNVAARLEGMCEPGGVSLSGAAHEQVRDRVKETFIDLGEQLLKNIARPVRVFALQSSSGSVARKGTVPAPEHREPPRLSIVVLPFANVGGDPEQDYFVDGVTDSLTTDLSRIRSAFVIARSTAFTFKGKPIDVRAIGRELNVRYALEGSVQRRGDRMRVNVQLLDAESGSHLWAERFDKPVASFFDMQDEIVARLANQLSVELLLAEARRSEKAPSPDALDLVFQGLAWSFRGPNLENLARARAFFEQALTLDPDNVGALVSMVCVDVTAATNFYPDDIASRLVAAEAAATKALSLAPENARAHECLGSILAITKRTERAIAECERALSIDPNLANAHANIGWCKAIAGREKETEAHIQEALRLSPRDIGASRWMSVVGAAKNYIGQHEEAVVWSQRSIEARRTNPMAHFHLAAALALMDRLEEAQATAAVGHALNPQFTVARFLGSPWSDHPAHLEGRRLIADGLRKAGLPEGAVKTT